MPPPYRGVLFDLFGTLVAFEPVRLPEIVIAGAPVRSTIGGLGALLAEWVPGASAEAFWQALMTVSEEMAVARATDHVELPSRERFRRALERIGCDEPALSEAAVHFSRRHMAMIAQATVFPARHAEVLAAVRARCRVGVVSNFDDTGTAYEILSRHEILPQLDTVVVSEALGLRKPHPALVRAGLRGLGLGAGDVLLVGDTFAEDVAAARAAGVDAAWLDTGRRGPPPGVSFPRHVLRALDEVLGIVGGP